MHPWLVPGHMRTSVICTGDTMIMKKVFGATPIGKSFEHEIIAGPPRSAPPNAVMLVRR